MSFLYEFIVYFALGLYLTLPIIGIIILLIVMMGLYIGSTEKWERSDAVYFAFITATTVGFGDFSPKKRANKYVAIVIALSGVLLTGIIVAVGLHAIQKAFENSHDVKSIEKRL